jgi:hypothetical protein
MYYVLYDKDFNALGKRKTYPCGSWSIKRKANEFDECTCEGLAIENDDGAEYVGLHDDYTSELLFFAFSGVPVTKDGRTKINAVDIKQLLNNDCVIDFTTVNTVSGLYNDLLTGIFDTTKYGYNMSINMLAPDLTGITGIVFKSELLERALGPGNVWKTLQAINAIYDCYISTVVDIINKTLQFKVNRINREYSINLDDFDTNKTIRDSTKTNMAVCYKKGAYQYKEIRYLLSNDTVVSTPIESLRLYPPVIEVFEDDEDINKAVASGLQKLYDNRYKASVEIPYIDLIKGIDLDCMVDIYGYKKLPVMQITEDNKNKKTIKLGRLDNYWWV